MTRPRPSLAALALALWASAQLAGQEAPAPLDLERALELAARNNETAGIAATRVERAQALRRQAIAALLPSLTVTGTYTRRPREITREVGDETVTVQARDAFSSQALAETTLFDLRALPLLRAANRGLEAQELESSELRRALAHDVATGYFLVLGAEQLLEASRERVRVAQVTAEEARLRVEAGLAGRNDATRSELELANARLAETRAANDAVTTRLSLAYLIGEPLEGRALLEPDHPAAPAGTREELVARAQAGRAELVALAGRAEQARELARVPRWGIVPRLDARGVYRTTNESGLSGREEDWNLAVGLTWELWDGGNREAVAAQRDAEARELELQLDQRRREVALEVSEVLAALESAEAGVEQASVRREVATANSNEIRERFQNGLATALEQADASVEQFEAESELVRQRYTRALARLALIRALGQWPGAQPEGAP
ncbi:MAG TPA: TolC family protein [Thermoanaerobaculia bacterium]|nr:TolC family protein [Thermoanaerobaculia bacterium]